MTAQLVNFGRREIYTDYTEITAANVVEVLYKAILVHNENKFDSDYLFRYGKGYQPILYRTKDVRPEICNKIVVNRANEIVRFKTGYLMGEPVQYVNRGEDTGASESIKLLNRFMFTEGKAAKDNELAEWFTTCGVAYRMVLPSSSNDPDESPFDIYTLDPRYAFVVKHSGLGHKVLMGVKYVITETMGTIYSVYTDREYFEIVDGQIRKHATHILGGVPIVEYVSNNFRQGEFECVLSMLDAINEVASNRVDGIEQFIQALMMFKGVDVEAEDFEKMRQLGGIKVPTEGDVKYLVQELNQTETQTLVDDMYQTVLTICGMPNRNGGKSTSDTGTAVIYRDGWSAAEARAKDTETLFKQSETEFLRLVLRISNAMRHLNLKVADVEIRFTRRNYENIQGKAQVLTTMLSNDKIHPRLAFEHCGLFVDPEVAFSMSEEYRKEQEERLVKELTDTSQDDATQSEEKGDKSV